MAKRVDRRVLRTKKALCDAILSLLQEQSYTSLTVQDITSRANVNRATFYLHYKDKEELLAESLEALFGELREEAAAKMEALPLLDNKLPTQVVFEHAAKYKALYEVLLDQTGPGFVMQGMIDAIVSFGQDYFQSRYSEEMLSRLRIPPGMIPHHMAGSLFGLLRWWMLEDMPYSAEEMAHLAHEFGMRGLLGMFSEEL